MAMSNGRQLSAKFMHPAIRIVMLVVFAATLAQGGVPRLLVSIALLTILYGTVGAVDFAVLGRMLKRMRWLFVSLVVVYLWFTPGEPLIPNLGAMSPSVEGLRVGALRVGLLIVLVAAVNLLLQSTSREQLLVGLYWLARPLQCLGLSRERLAVRMVLVLETVPHLQFLLRDHKRGLHGKSAVRFVGETAARYFEAALEKAEQAPCGTIEIPEGRRPPAYQWLYPVLLGVLGWFVT